MTIENITRQIGVHADEITLGASYGYVYAMGGKLGYGQTAYDAIRDSECEDVEETLGYEWASPEFPFVAQCYSAGEEAGLLFKF